MFDDLQIYSARERWMVGSADLLLNTCAAVARRWPGASRRAVPERILLLRLERIGDLLMTLGAIRAVRARAPAAAIHLVVGEWNASLARLVPDVDSHESLDARWLSRRQAGDTARTLVSRAWAWRARRFDLALNFEPDIRSNGLLALSGARRRVGFSSGGGGGFLTDALSYDPNAHTAENALRVVAAALPRAAGASEPPVEMSRLSVSASARAEAVRLIGIADREGRPLVGVHASGGRAVKQWSVDRFAEVATRLAREHWATIVLTGADEDRPIVARLRERLPDDVAVCDVSGSVDLAVLAAILEQLDLFVTGDTGPMHLAAAVGTPVVAVFGPSDPVRYGPLDARARVVTANLWCRPCNRVRRPPERCTVGVPDCLAGVHADAAVTTAADLLARARI